MAPLRSRLDEVLSAGFAHMRLVPTGMRSNKRNVASDWEEVAMELEAARTRDEEDRQAHKYLKSVSDDELSKQAKQLAREQKAMPKNRLGAKHAANRYGLQELMDAYGDDGGREAAKERLRNEYAASPESLQGLVGDDDDDEDDEKLYSEFTDEDLLQEFVNNGDVADRLHADEALGVDEVREELEALKESPVPMTNALRNKIKRRMISEWVNKHPGVSLPREDPMVKYLMEDLAKLGTGPITWDGIRQTWRVLENERRTGFRERNKRSKYRDIPVPKRYP